MQIHEAAKLISSLNDQTSRRHLSFSEDKSFLTDGHNVDSSTVLTTIGIFFLRDGGLRFGYTRLRTFPWPTW